MRASIPKQPTVNHRLPAASSHSDTIHIISDSDCIEDIEEEEEEEDDDDADEEYVPLSTSTSEEEADEDDASSLGSVRTDDDADRIRSALRMALYETPKKRVIDLTSQNGADSSLLDGMA
jgi:hypothetical protein